MDVYLRCIGLRTLQWGAALVAAAALPVRIAPGTPLVLDDCAPSARQQFRVDAAAPAVTTPDGALCVTYAGPSPAALQMQPCVPGGAWNQSIVHAPDSSLRLTLPGGDCVAWNSQGATISTWPCSSIAWNGVFGADYPFPGALSENFTEHSAAFSGLCASMGTPPCPAPTCSSSLDCNLNGECDAGSGACTCYKPWGGATCGELKFLPIAPPAERNGFPGLSPNETTWGGNAILWNDGQYHLFVAEMTRNCTLAQWGSNSQIAHAVSSSPEGPYLRHDVAVGVWAHNPQVSYIPQGGGGGQDLWALWHIGSGGAPGGGQDCSSPAAASAALPALAAQGGSALHLANSPYGPWEAFEGPLPDCNNPTQMRHANGTWFLVCNSNMLYRGPNVTGPWEYVLNIPSGRTPGIFEDGFLYQDGRGNWHQFFHTYTMTCDTPRCDPTAISGHSFSADGLRWYSSCVQPYFNTANVTDGSTVRMSTRERPKLIFGADGEPVALSNGVCPMPNCYPQAAIQCKVQGLAPNRGYWDHTRVARAPASAARGWRHGV
jgi:hypothetical protein